MRNIEGLICPASGDNLQLSGSGTEYVSSGGTRYAVINGKPILIDFNKSLVDRKLFFNTSGGSAVDRQKMRGFWMGKFIKKLLSPVHRQIVRNTRNVISLWKPSEKVRVLIVGGGTVGKGNERFHQAKNFEIISCDVYDSPNVDVICDAHSLPFSNNSFDLVIIQYVLEHVLKPQVVVAEIHRVLKEGGVVYAETPFLEQVHEGPYDFTRFTESGHRYLFKAFSRIDSGVVAGPGTHLVWTIEYTARGLFRSRAVGKAVKLLFFWLHWLDRLIPVKHQVDAADSVYFIGKKEASFSFEDHEIICYYGGAE